MRNSKPTHREKKDPQSIRSGPFLRLGTETMLRHATNSATTSCGHSGVVSIGKVDFACLFVLRVIQAPPCAHQLLLALLGTIVNTSEV